MKNLDTVMKRDEAIKSFEETYMPVINAREKVNGKKDMPRRRQLWNDFCDSLNKNGLISDWQAENWSQPEHICEF
jgi:hypothetical protein|tara:strand:- start:119 stop:343 length:225 start_codon:yes stop_codon:yes gene_type:complete